MIFDNAAGSSKNARRISGFVVLAYAVFGSYLFPQGIFESVPQIKPVYTAVWAVVVLAMLVYTVERGRSARFSITLQGAAVAAFFVLNILVTLVDLHGLGEGLRTLFGWPVLFLWLAFACRARRKEVLSALANVLALLFFLQDACAAFGVFNESVHLSFLGHVQVVGQEGLVAFLCIALGFRERAVGEKRAALLASLVVVALIVADADSSKVVLVLALVALLLFRLKGFVDYVGHYVVPIVVALLVLSVVVVWLSVIRSNLFGLSWDFSGRGFVWRAALALLATSPLLGFGIQGVKMDLFWGSSMNYAHNQLMQTLLDGGIVLCISFVVMLLACAVLVKRIPDKSVRYVFTVALGIYLVLMIFDSATYYCFIYMILAPIGCYSGSKGYIEYHGVHQPD